MQKTHINKPKPLGVLWQQSSVKKVKPQPKPDLPQGWILAPAPDMTRQWQDYIEQRLDRRDRIAARAIAQSIGKDLVAAERRIEQLEREIAELKNRDLDRRLLRAVPSSGPPALIA